MLTRFQMLNILIIQIIAVLTLESVFAQKSEKNVADALSIIADENANERFMDLLTESMNQVRNNPIMGIDDSFIMTADHEAVLAAVKPFEDDSSPKVRSRAYTIAWKIAKNSTSKTIRQEVVMKLLKAASDPDTFVWQQASRRILLFNRVDFSEDAKESIRQLVVSDNPKHLHILAAGVANLQGLETRLRALLIDESQYEIGDHVGQWYGTIGWAARLALARMGNKDHIKQVIEIVESETDLDVRIARLLKDIAYIRQPEAVDVLKQYLVSNEATASNLLDVRAMPYTQYAMDLLAEIIIDFPVQKKYIGSYSQSEIDQARKWMKKKSNWMNSIRR